METSAELKELTLRCYTALSSRDIGFFEQYFSQQDGVLAIGTDPQEWWAGYATIIKVFKIQMEEMGQFSLQAIAHMLTGHGLAGLARWEAAADAYRRSCELYEVLGRTGPATESLAGLARIVLAQGHTAQALIHVEPILVQVEARHLEGAEEPLRVDLTCCQVLRAANDPRAGAVLERTHSRLQEQAAKITDVEMRRVFLEHVPYHREIIAAWAAAQEQAHSQHSRPRAQ